MMIVVNAKDLVALGIFAIALVVCIILFVVEVIAQSISRAVKKRQQKRMDDAFREDGE